MSNQQRYLVGIDGSDLSLAALRWATELASRTGARVTAVSTWTIPAAVIAPGGFGTPSMPIDVFEEAARGRLTATVAAANAEIEVEPAVINGHPGPVLAELSRDCSLVVVGRTGRGLVSRMLTGSTARHLARHATCPVALIGATPPDGDVVVAIDGSAHSIGALRWATQLPIDTKLAVVHAHDEQPLADISLTDPLRTTLHHRAESLVHETLVEAEVDAADVVTEIHEGDPRTTVVDAVGAADLLVVGSAGHSGLAGVVLGSVTNYAIDHVPGSLVVWRDVS